MRFPKEHRLEDIANILGCSFVGDPNFLVTGANEIHMVEPGDIVFVDHPKYYDKALNSAATTILINKEVDCPEGKALLISDDPFRDFNKLTKRFMPFEAAKASIAPTAMIGEGTIIQPGAFIGNHVHIGKNCLIHPNVVIYDHIQIGDNVVIHANTVLGADAFYYKKRPEGFDQLLSGGSVLIEDDVHIGASCTIDRGVSGVTRIGRGTKIDNHVQIGHDTQIGEKCLFASQVGIAGCVVIGNEVTFWGQVGCTSGISIGDKAVILAQSGISKSLEGGKTYFGYPADEARKKYREMASLSMLPEIIEQVRKKED
ncbi:MAG: UDP-3-O-(3-hydroxymyristoyl)glucosamine N-acyltransferase [Bacteroidota bacterium]|nr:UDP-3-O-(3-hydroxymyristoyl)glucosamine N-acyltransferase [Bacteroidota bacterium]